MDILWHERALNLKKAESLIKNASLKGSDIAVLPEMFDTGFSISAPLERDDGETMGFLSRTSRLYKIAIVAGSAVLTDGGAKNMAFVFSKTGRCIARYSKLYPFSYAGEHRHFSRGDSPLVFRLGSLRASVFICYDLRFPEAMRQVAKKVQSMFFIANWPASRIEHWDTLLRARAIENQCFVIGVNRKGIDGNGIIYNGGSAVFDPLGNRVPLKGKGQLLIADIEPKEVGIVRKKFPFLKDMRI
jgi:predicted amidohydrolase